MAWEIEEYMSYEEKIYWEAYFRLNNEIQKKASKEMNSKNKSNSNKYKTRLNSRAMKSYGH